MCSTGITGQSSGRTTCVNPNTYLKDATKQNTKLEQKLVAGFHIAEEPSPEDHIHSSQVPIMFTPAIFSTTQPFPYSRVLVREVSSWKVLLSMERGGPQVALQKWGSSHKHGLRTCKKGRVTTRYKAVRSGGSSTISFQSVLYLREARSEPANEEG